MGLDVERLVNEALAHCSDGQGQRGELVVVSASAGGTAGLLLRSVGARLTGRATHLHVLAGRAGGEHGSFAITAHPDPTDQRSYSGDTMGSLLEQLEPEPGSVVLVDGFQSLPAAAAHSLVAWFQQVRNHGVNLITGYQPVLDVQGLRNLLHLVYDARWLTLGSLTDGEVAAWMEGVVPAEEDEIHDAVVAACSGSMEMARELRRSLRSVPVLTMREVDKAHRNGILATGLRVVHELGHEAQLVACVCVDICPEGTVLDAGELVGLAPDEMVRYQQLFREIALQPTTEHARSVVAPVIRESMPPAVRARSRQLARVFLEDHGATARRVFEMAAAGGADLTGERALAQRALDEAMAAGELAFATQVLSSMRRSRDPEEIAWARARQLELWAASDWERLATKARTWGRNPEVRAQLGDIALPAELALEDPEAADLILGADLADQGDGPLDARRLNEIDRHLWAGRRLTPAMRELIGQSELPEPVEASMLALRALRGSAVEERLGAFEKRIQGARGPLASGATVASRIGLSWLCLADYKRAATWASLATFTARRTERASCGLGYLVAAQATLRLGNLEGASEQALAGRSLFEELGAPRLAMLAQLTADHSAIERGAPAPDRSGEVAGAHPLIVSYATYLNARSHFLRGDVDAAIRTHFDCGRQFGSCHIDNPTLLNWRPHLMAIFRAAGHEEFASQIEAELLTSFAQWGEANPRAATRRAAELGVGTQAESSEAASDVRAALSVAERRVVEAVMSGASNREAAQQLFLSKRTVDTHLSNIYRKLAVGSRQELIQIFGREREEQKRPQLSFG